MTTLAVHSPRETTSPHSATAYTSGAAMAGAASLARSAPHRAEPLVTYDRAKRFIDVCVAALVLIAASPVLLLIVCAIRLDSRGPAVFRQVRTGKGGRRFVLHKFRTMQERGDVPSGHRQPARPFLKAPDDPRVTRVGRFLRAWSLDELPNLWTVLRGDIALVGPRPTSWDTDAYEPWQLARLEILPGVVGLPEVMGRSTLDFDTKVRLDLEYIKHRSLRLDFHVLMLTARAVLSRVGAY